MLLRLVCAGHAHSIRLQQIVSLWCFLVLFCRWADMCISVHNLYMTISVAQLLQSSICWRAYRGSVVHGLFASIVGRHAQWAANELGFAFCIGDICRPNHYHTLAWFICWIMAWPCMILVRHAHQELSRVSYLSTVYMRQWWYRWRFNFRMDVLVFWTSCWMRQRVT